jgi:hypothetical protein
MCEVDVALFLVDPSFVLWLLGTCNLFVLAYAVCSCWLMQFACASLAYAVWLPASCFS